LADVVVIHIKNATAIAQSNDFIACLRR
jgi:hypothetical protein